MSRCKMCDGYGVHGTMDQVTCQTCNGTGREPGTYSAYPQPGNGGDTRTDRADPAPQAPAVPPVRKKLNREERRAVDQQIQNHLHDDDIEDVLYDLYAEIASLRQQLKGCAIVAQDYQRGVEFLKEAGYGEEWKKVAVCRQSLDGALEQLARWRHSNR